MWFFVSYTVLRLVWTKVSHASLSVAASCCGNCNKPYQVVLDVGCFEIFYRPI